MVSMASSENLWESLLRESSKRSSSTSRHSSTSNVVILGDSLSLKSAVISILSNNSAGQSNSTDSSTTNTSYSIVEYQSFTAEDGNVVNLWSYDHNIWGLTPTVHTDFVYDATVRDQIIFLVLLDLTTQGKSSESSIIKSLRKWISYIKFRSDYLKSLYGVKYAQERNQTISKYLTKKSVGEAASSSLNCHNFGFPVIIVGILSTGTGSLHESPSSSVDDFQELQRLKLVQGQIRKIGLDVGAAVLFASLGVQRDRNDPSQPPTSVVNSKLKKYMLHRLTQEAPSPQEQVIEEFNGGLFIPAGTDSIDLIIASTGHKPALDLVKIDSDDLGMNIPSLDASPLPSLQVEIENEKDWLYNLQSFVNQFTATTGVLQPSVSSSRRGTIIDSRDIDAASLSTSDLLSSSHDISTSHSNHLPRSNSDVNVTNGLTEESRGRLSLDTSAAVTDPKVKTPLTGIHSKSKRGPVGEQDKQEVGDFFKNLMVTGTSAKGPKK